MTFGNNNALVKGDDKYYILKSIKDINLLSVNIFEKI